MVLPIRGFQRPPESLVREAILRAELKAITQDASDLRKFREYYDGEQELVYTTELFETVFGPAFEGFRDNWMRIIIEAVDERLKFTGLAGGLTAEEQQENQAAAEQVYNVFLNNNIAREQENLHEGALVEGRAYMIVWPDEDLGATMDWQPAGTVRIRYDSDRRRRALWAIKRWQEEDGQVFVTIYTDTAVWKYVERESTDANIKPSSQDVLDEIPDLGALGSLQPREVSGERFPLPHRLGRVPVVEFSNKSYRSELVDHIPQQDALNKTLLDMLISGEYHAAPQRYAETTQTEPVGGWKSGGAEVWQFKPGFDAEGKPIKGQYGVFQAGSPANFIKVIEMWLEHMALTSRTPARLFRQVDRGGRGDAPSGDALLVEDKPLNDKVITRQEIFEPPWLEVARLVARSIRVNPEIFRRGKVLWRDPRHEFRTAVLAEAQAMLDLGMPFEFVIRQLWLSPEEIEEVIRLKEEEREKEMQEQREQMEMQAELRPEPSSNESPDTQS